MSTPDPLRVAEFTWREARVAARWLRRQAEATGLKHAEHLTDRRHKPRKVVTLPRDAQGRWVPR